MHIPMLVILGVFLILIGIILDDGTTWILMSKGLAVLESNPIYLAIGFWGFICVMILCYLFAILAWTMVVNGYKTIYHKRYKIHKVYDLFLFMFCVWIIFFASTKMEAGYNNLQIMYRYWHQEPALMQQVQDMQDYKESNPVEFKAEMQSQYFNSIAYNFSYLKLWLYVILGYLLFRVGVKVCPYDEA